MNRLPDIQEVLAVDAQGVDKLRQKIRREPDQALRAVAQQFESLFMNMLLKSMREATPQDGLFDSEETRFYTSMLDQQLVQHLSVKGRGMGLADIMVRQLSRAYEQNLPRTAESGELPAADMQPLLPPEEKGLPLLPALQRQLQQGRLDGGQANIAGDPQSKQSQGYAPFPVSRREPHDADVAAFYSGNTATVSPREFVNVMLPHARAVSQITGIPAGFMVGHAALESGWGKHEIRYANGNPSYNLFGIKTGRNWSGPAVEVVTTEYIDGTPRKVTEKFRAYGSYAEAFQDYAGLLRQNPRYSAVLERQDIAGFARGLQQAGYATDPGYASKLEQILRSDALRNLTA